MVYLGIRVQVLNLDSNMVVGDKFKDSSSGLFKVVNKVEDTFTIKFVKRPLEGEMTIANPKYALSFNEFTLHEPNVKKMLDLGIIKII